MSKYRIEVNEEQLKIIQISLEEYFRLRLGQERDFVDDFAALNCDFSQDNPHHDEIFDRFIHRRDAISEVMKAVFRIGYGSKGWLEEKTPEMLIAEDLWDSIRFARGVSRGGQPLHLGGEPPAKITKIEEESKTTK